MEYHPRSKITGDSVINNSAGGGVKLYMKGRRIRGNGTRIYQQMTSRKSSFYRPKHVNC
jgi:hypothetical protein